MGSGVAQETKNLCVWQASIHLITDSLTQSNGDLNDFSNLLAECRHPAYFTARLEGAGESRQLGCSGLLDKIR